MLIDDLQSQLSDTRHALEFVQDSVAQLRVDVEDLRRAHNEERPLIAWSSKSGQGGRRDVTAQSATCALVMPSLLESDSDDEQNQHEKADDDNGCRDRDCRLAPRQNIVHCSGLSRNEAHFGIVKRCDCCLDAS